MIFSKILISLFFAGITSALFYPAIKLGQGKNIIDLPENKCVQKGKYKNDYCQEWNGACYSGKCSDKDCTNCVKPFQILPTILLFISTLTFLITVWFLLDGILGKNLESLNKNKYRMKLVKK